MPFCFYKIYHNSTVIELFIPLFKCAFKGKINIQHNILKVWQVIIRYLRQNFIWVFVNPFVSFTKQEPEDDPRYCCYLWVARGPMVPENCPETPATLTLYQLFFASRDHLPGYGIIYKVTVIQQQLICDVNLFKTHQKWEVNKYYCFYSYSSEKVFCHRRSSMISKLNFNLILHLTYTLQNTTKIIH